MILNRASASDGAIVLMGLGALMGGCLFAWWELVVEAEGIEEGSERRSRIRGRESEKEQCIVSGY